MFFYGQNYEFIIECFFILLGFFFILLFLYIILFIRYYRIYFINYILSTGLIDFLCYTLNSSYDNNFSLNSGSLRKFILKFGLSIFTIIEFFSIFSILLIVIFFILFRPIIQLPEFGDLNYFLSRSFFFHVLILFLKIWTIPRNFQIQC